MKVLQEGTMKDGTAIQIEDWSENYSFMKYASTIAAYPISKMGYTGQFTPRKGERWRMQYDFKSNEEAQEAYLQLIEGSKSLKDFESNLYNKKYKDCI